MNIIKTSALLIFCAFSFQLSGATIPFRLGEILSAEISRNKVTIKDLNAIDYNLKFKHYAYAVIVLKLHKGRSLSIYDFKLNLIDETYQCIAMSAADKTFDTKNWEFAKTSPKTLYSLLFIVDSETLGNAKRTITANLIYALNKSGRSSYEIPFKFINYVNLTQINKIPQDGIFPKVEIKNTKISPGNVKR